MTGTGSAGAEAAVKEMKVAQEVVEVAEAVGQEEVAEAEAKKKKKVRTR
jgi:hypothetical protein